VADTPEELAAKFKEIPKTLPSWVPTFGQDPAGIDMWIETKEGDVQPIHGYTPQYLEYEEMKELEEESSSPFMKLWKNAENNLPPGTVVPVPGPPGPQGPMGPQGEKGEPGEATTRLVLPPGNYTAEEVNKMIQAGKYDGITLAGEGTTIVGPNAAKITPSSFKPDQSGTVLWKDNPHNPRNKPGKQPQDHQKKKKPDKSGSVWHEQQLQNQQELIERATKLLEDKVLVIQVLEAQIDDMRRVNERQTKRIDDLLKVVADHDDRINWLET